ncbi:putative metallophosphoesterase At3g03305 isoform X2 [Phragmites australis]|uniref:putative metallophosphoesterase At3g03305 isoform X2 n=1 Tax=Phragmites australis TaxID=29695 RepID=UPI002D7A2FA0|nr:putative metallophosphoesterase At3g03305 isoform X2 [Phragmites australis]
MQHGTEPPRDSVPCGDPRASQPAAMPSELPPPVPLLLFLLLLVLRPCASWQAAVDDASVSRSAFPMDGNVAWVVQVSNLHISAYHPERAADLARILGASLRAIRPHLLLVTGDITGR